MENSATNPRKMTVHTLVIDNDGGTEIETFTSQADLDTRAESIVREEWSEDQAGPWPGDWDTAYEALHEGSCELYLYTGEHEVALPAPVAAKVDLADAFISHCRAAVLDDDDSSLTLEGEGEGRPHALVTRAATIDATGVCGPDHERLAADLDSLVADLPETFSNEDLKRNAWLGRIILAGEDLASRISLEALDTLKRGGKF